MPKKARPKFEPAYFEPVSDPSNLGQRVSERMAIEVPRLDELMQHYGIRPAHETRQHPILPWMLLALALARDFVPNFEPKPRAKAGRKLSSDSYAIILEVETLAKERNISVTAACKLLSEQDRAPWKGRDVRSIEADYYARKKRLRELPSGKVMYEVWQAALSKNPRAAGNAHHEFALLMAMDIFGPIPRCPPH